VAKRRWRHGGDAAMRRQATGRGGKKGRRAGVLRLATRRRCALEKAGPGRLIDAYISSALAQEASVVAGPGAFVLV